MKKKEIDHERIISSGNSLKQIGYLMIVIVISTSISLLIYSSASSLRESENAVTVARICGIINLLCSVVIILQIISAGDNLINSFVDVVILNPEEIKAKEEILQTYGGVIVSQQSNHGLVVANSDLVNMKWDDAIICCKELKLNGFDDWRLPTKEELNILYQNKNIIESFENVIYWSSTEDNNNSAWCQSFKKGKQYNFYKSESNMVIAVRSF